jgi:hypothetical protein
MVIGPVTVVSGVPIIPFPNIKAAQCEGNSVKRKGLPQVLEVA